MEELLWHYTNAVGLLGILESNEIWASNIEFLNDFTENSRFGDIVRKRMLSFDLTETERATLLAKRVQAPDAFVDPAANLFVASFSECRDSLSQWRAYGTLAIGFSKHELLALNYDPNSKIGKTEYRRFFGPVHYYSEKNDALLIETVARSVLDAMRSGLINSLPESIPSGVPWFTQRFKDAAFGEEKEWRLICRGNIDYMGIEFRPGVSSVIPYVKVSLGNTSPVKEVLIGPGATRDLNESAMNLFRDARHFDFKVSKTNVPFRNW